MPPAISPMQGSRAGIVTALIVSIIIAVAMIVVAVYYAQSESQTRLKLSDLQAQDRTLVPDGAATDPKVTMLQNWGKDQGLGTALEASMAQSDQLAKLVAGDLSPDKAAQQARTILTDTSKAIGELNGNKLVAFTMPPNASLSSAVSTLTNQVKQLATDNKNKDDQIATTEQSKQQLIAAQKQQLDQKDKQIQEANAKAEAAANDAKRFQDEATQANAALQQTANQGLTKAQGTNADLSKQVQDTTKKLTDAERQIRALMTKLHQARVNPGEAIVQHADGNIIRISDNNVVFINLGQRQSVTKGLTFEIYDKAKGVPPLGNGLSDTDMPVGKGSVEVFDVGPDTSACRVVKTQPGEQIVVGDLISNLVFDPNTKYNFVVYGDFDLSGSGATSPTDAEIVKRLIAQWGGKLQDHVDVDTDFVVMGAEPQLYSVTDQNDPQQQIRHVTSQRQVDKYQAEIKRATDLSVPIMNQNRFLYFIGYYDQAKR